MSHLTTNRSGFSTILAMLLTAFLIVLSAGVLTLFLSENRINHFLFDGVATYMGAEWSLEYALLKGKNHREGFSDTIRSDGKEGNLLGTGTKKLRISYETESTGKSYSGTIEKGKFEIIPLFTDRGKIIGDDAKNPWTDTSMIEKTREIVVRADNEIIWNIVANDESGTTFGLVGTGGINRSFGDAEWAELRNGFEKYADSEWLAARTREIGDFLSSYENAYLLLYTVSDSPVHYSITATNEFALPYRRIVASSSIGTSKQNIEFREDRSKIFDILKYSLFSQ